MRRANILWFDDDLRAREEGKTPERLRLQPWLRWFNTEDRASRICLIETNCVDDFARILVERKDIDKEHKDYIDAILIDLMWRESSRMATNFNALGFPQEKVIPLDAGAQLIGLLLNESFKATRPHWLTPYGTRNIATLTTLTDHTLTMQKYLDANALKKITAIKKDIEIGAEGNHAPSKSFVDWVNNITITQT